MVDRLPPQATTPASASNIADALRRTPGDTPRVRPGRGRPPGAKNLTPIERAQREREAAIKKGQTPPKSTDEELKAKAEAIKSDALVIEAMITEQLNEHIMGMVMEVLRLRPEAIYASGHVPPSQAHLSKYTELGNRFAIPPSLAKSMSKLAAEAKNTDAGQKFNVVTDNGKLGLVIAGVTTLWSAFGYAKSLNQTLAEIKAMREAEMRPVIPVTVVTEQQQVREGVVG